jgi:hypothetical protein
VGCDELLKTIKYNPKDLKGLKNSLPKSNYHQQPPSQDGGKPKPALEGSKDLAQSTKKKEPSAPSDQKIKDFLEKRKVIESK